LRHFVGTLITAVDQNTTFRIKAALLRSGGTVARPRRRTAKQLCPVPGCKNPAAPIFGMVCAEHKDVSKRKIKEYREARRRAKAAARGGPKAEAKKSEPPGELERSA
jgi:hypothetical protein